MLNTLQYFQVFQQKKSFQPLEDFPTIGKKSFQPLEKFPTIGKNSSNDWKKREKKFQWLEIFFVMNFEP